MGLDEFALCVRKEILPPLWLSENTSLPVQWSELDFLNGRFEFHCRREIESDYAWKQIVPYVLSFTNDGRVLIYQRRGTETRLHGLWSVGIGGHVNQTDALSSNFRETLITGMERECKEELGVEGLHYSLLGVINEEQTAVGHAHLGIVFKTVVPVNFPASSELSEWKFVLPQHLKIFRFELWSSLALQLPEKY